LAQGGPVFPGQDERGGQGARTNPPQLNQISGRVCGGFEGHGAVDCRALAPGRSRLPDPPLIAARRRARNALCLG